MNFDMNSLMSMAKIMGGSDKSGGNGGGMDMMSMLSNMLAANKAQTQEAQEAQSFSANAKANGSFAAVNGLGIMSEPKKTQSAPAQDLTSMLPMLMNLFAAPKAKAAAAEAPPEKKTERRTRTGEKNPQFFYDKIKRRPEKKAYGFSAVSFGGYELVDSLKKLKASLEEVN